MFSTHSSFSTCNRHPPPLTPQTWSSPAALAACNKPGADEAATTDTSVATAKWTDASPPASYFASGPLGLKADPNGNSTLWNAMIVPYTTGPMALAGITW